MDVLKLLTDQFQANFGKPRSQRTGLDRSPTPENGIRDQIIKNADKQALDTAFAPIREALGLVGGLGTALATYSPEAEAAFRPSGTSVLSQELRDQLTRSLTGAVQYTKKAEPNVVTNAGNAKLQDAYANGLLTPYELANAVRYSVLSKLTPRELSKYGTSEFVLDPLLGTTRGEPTRVVPLTVSDIIKSYSAGNIARSNYQIADAVAREQKALATNARYAELMGDYIKNDAAKWQLEILKRADDVTAAASGKTVYGVPRLSDLNTISPDVDISRATHAMAEVAQRMPNYDPTKALPQQVKSILTFVENEQKQLAKSAELTEKGIKGRTAAKESKDGFVELNTLQDISDETAVLNHCIGQVCRTGGKYTPALNPATGKPNVTKDWSGAEGEVANNYHSRMLRGDSKYYSYRPEGMPQFTLEVNKSGKLMQAYGEADRKLTSAESDIMRQFLDSLGMAD